MKHIKAIVVMLVLMLLLQSAAVGMAAGTAEQGSGAEKPYIIWFDEAAPWSVEGFERWSLPLGNGYTGINVFGGVETELLSVTENSVFNPGSGEKGTLDSATGIYYNDFGDERIDAASGGLNLMAKTYIDFAGHTTAAATDYKRELSLNDSVAKVSYVYNGVTYTREYFTTYPDKVTVMRLTASEAGKLSFTLRPEIPFCYDPDVDPVKYSYLDEAGDGMYKTGKVTAAGDTITLKGTMEYFGTDFEGLYKVIPTGGSMNASNDANGKNGTITVTDADSAIIIMAAGTNYDYDYITFDKAKGMLNAAPDPHEKVQGWLDAAAAKSYDQLLAAHQADYREFFDRAGIDLGGVYDPTLPTDQLVTNYQNGISNPYLEEMAFQFGRYLLICSSREGCLPSNLQGIWNFADSAAWSGGYWHNINVQMNYWPAFNTGLAELFQSYVDYNEAMREKAYANADSFLKTIKAPGIATAGTGENGYTIGTGCTPYVVAAASTGGHSGPGTVAFTSLLFWDWYEFTQDRDILKDHVYPAVEGAAKFLSKTVKKYDDGKYLVYSSASPENLSGVDPVTGKQLYIRTVGCAFDQQMVYANHLATLQAAEILGLAQEDYPILATLNEQIDKLDPVNVGYSGQVKEYREENFYGEFGEKQHRHISQLVGVYPASVINSSTDAWLEAAAVSLENRGYTNIAWGVVHRLLCWARIQDADQAYASLQMMLKEHMGYSLFSNYNSLAMLASRKHNNPFQIEANFGYTAAVAEMLVQSQAGYLEFLPTLPDAWADGSFRGLTCRGNFAVDAAWENGVATSFTIESRSGADCAVKYPNVANAVVKDSKGNTVAFTADASDMISFPTTEGETYTISSIPAHTPGLSAPESLSLSASGNSVSLNWTAVSGAAGYNVYRAVNDAATYELVASNVSGTSYNYTHTDIKGSDRLTMRVTAVAADGTESRGALDYALPVAALDEVTGYMFEGNDLQLEFEAADNATEYRAYANGTLVATSKYPIIAVRNADPTATYTVSAVVDGRESAVTQATIYHAAKQDNIMLHKPMTLEGRAYWIDMDKNAGTKYDGALAVNGNTATNNSKDRWAVSDSKQPFSVTADLQGIYKLGTLKIYEWGSGSESKTRSNNTKVEVLTPNGEWVTVKEGFSLAWRAATTVDVGGVLASQIRFTFQNTVAAKSACIAEITCTGEKIDAVNKIKLLEAVQAYAGLNVKSAAFTGTGYTGVQVAYILAEPEALKVLADTTADQHTVDKAVRALTKAATGPNIFKNKTVTPASGLVQIGSYSPAMMVDGKVDGADASRLAVSSNTKPDPRNVAVTVKLNGLYYLEGVFVQEFLNEATRITNGGNVTIEVSTDGSTWTTVLSGVSLREYRDGIPSVRCSNTAFVLENTVLANQVRVTFYDKHNSKDNITIYELQAYGEKVDESSLYLSSNLLTLDSGKSHTLTPSVAGVTWASSDPNVVSVDSTGKLTAINLGSATVTATDASGNKASCEVTVLCDTSALEQAIADAKTAITGVRGIDRTADRVVSGVKFVPTERLAALEQAIAKAESALPTATTAALVNAAASALNTELGKFNAALKTGTMNIANHKHCVCAGAQDHTCAAVTWTAWGDSEAERTSLPTAKGNYFLVDEIVVSKEYVIGNDTPDVAVSICLNGFDIVGQNTTSHVYSVYSKLNVCDCSEEAKWGSIMGSYTGDFTTIQLRDNRENKGEMNLYSGIITSVDSASATGNVIRLGNSNTNGSTFRMYGGKIIGGGVYILSKSTFHMYGGEINGTTATVGSCFYSLGTVNISGGALKGSVYLAKGKKLALNDLSSNNEIVITMAEPGAFATGAKSADIKCFTSADETYEVFYNGGELSLVEKGSIMPLPQTMDLLYDDRIDLVEVLGRAESVSITKQNVTSYRVGTQEKDAQVLLYENGILYAVGTGTATLEVDGSSCAVTVKPAPISLFMITGHSVGNGVGGSGAQSVAIEAGQAYSTHIATTRSVLGSNAVLDPSEVTQATGLGYFAEKRLTGIDAFAKGNGGNIGEGSGLAWQWNNLTGEKVWIINAAVGGSCLNGWIPGATTTVGGYSCHYDTSLAAYQNAQQILTREIAAGHYTMSHMAIIYHSAANFSSFWEYDTDLMRHYYDLMWEGYKESLACDMDGDGDTETVELMGMVPIWTYATGYNYHAFDKPNNYYTGVSAEYPDMFLASLSSRNWLTDDKLDAFPEITYTTQSKPVYKPESVRHIDQGGTSDRSVFCSTDSQHLSQVSYNAVGIDIAGSLYNVIQKNTEVKSVRLETVSHVEIGDTIALSVGQTIELLPFADNVYANDLRFVSSDSIRLSFPLQLTTTKAGTGTLTVMQGDRVVRTVTIQVNEQGTDSGHVHCVCTGTMDHTCIPVAWTAWGDDEAERTSLPVASGNYYLVHDIQVDKGYSIGNDNIFVEVKLCLNGHNVVGTHTTDHLYNVYSTFHLCDCSEEEEWGKFSGSDVAGAATIQLRDNRQNRGTMYFYSGILTAEEGIESTSGGIIRLGNSNENGATFNMYGGKLCGGRSDIGGAMTVMSKSRFNMYGGTITDNCADSGGNIHTQGRVFIYGGTIDGAKTRSGAVSTTVYVDTNGSLFIYGGTFTEGLSLEGTTIQKALAADCVLTDTDSHVPLRLADGATTSGTESVAVMKQKLSEKLVFSAASVSLYSDLSVNFKVSEALLNQGGFADPYVVFSFGGNKTEVATYRLSDGKLSFRFDQIAPHQIGETITATLYATKDGILYCGQPATYSVEQYCQRILARYTSDSYAELRTLLVDLLNYGAAAQLYVDPNTAKADLVNNWLTEDQLAWGSSGDVEVSNAVAGEEQTLGATPTVTCHGVGLTLADSVAIRFKLKADSTEGLAVKFTANGKTYEVTEFKPVTGEAGYYYVYFRNLNASQLRSTVKAVVYQNGVAVSNTFCYSVECYVANNMADSNEALAALVTAVIRYGDAAAAYVN